MAIQLKDASNYEEAVKEGTTLVVFYADWCGPCKMLHPVLEELDKDGHNIIKIDSDKNPQLMTMFGLMGVPAMIIYKDGKAVEKTSGYRPKVQLEGWLKKYE